MTTAKRPMMTLAQAASARAPADQLELLPHVIDACRAVAATGSARAPAAGDVLVAEGATVVILEKSPGESGPVHLRSPGAEPADAGTVAGLGALLELVVSDVAPAELRSIAERARRGEVPGAAELADALEKLHSAEPARAVEPAQARRRSRLRRALAAHPLLGAASAALLLVVGAALVVALLHRETRRERDALADKASALAAARRDDAYRIAQAHADKATTLARADLHLSAAVHAAASLRELDPDDGRPQVAELAVRNRAHIVRAELGLVRDLKRARDAGKPIAALASSGDGALLATAAGRAIKLWRGSGDPAGALTGHADEVVAIALSPDGAELVSASASEIVVWNVAERALVRRHPRAAGHAALDLALSPDRARLAAAERNGTVSLWRAPGTAPASPSAAPASPSAAPARPSTARASPSAAPASPSAAPASPDTAAGREPVRAIPAHPSGATAVAFGPQPRQLASGGQGGEVRLWDPDTGVQLGQLVGHTSAIRDLAYSPDGALLASASADGAVRLWRLADRELHIVLPSPSASRAIAFAPDGIVLFAAGEDGVVRGWFTADGRPALAVEAHQDGATGVACMPSGDQLQLASAGRDGRLLLWRLALPGGALSAEREITSALDFSPDGAALVAATADHKVLRWRTAGGAALPPLTGHTGAITAVSHAPDGGLIATASLDGTARLWRADSGEALAPLRGHTGGVHAIAFSPDGALLVTAGEDATVRIWPAQGGAPLEVLRSLTGPVTSLALSRDGARLASADERGTVQLWSLSAGGRAADPGQALRGEGRWNAVRFSRDGAHLVAAGEAGATVWRTSDLSEVVVVRHPGAPVLAAAIEGELLVTAGADGTARLWSLPAGRPLLSLPAASGLVALSPDGRTLAWADGLRIRLAGLDLAALTADPADLLRAAEKRSGLGLDGFHTTHRAPDR